MMLRTQRLTLRQWQDSDRSPFVAMNTDVEVMRYFPNTLTPAETEKTIEKIQSGFRLHEWGLWSVVLRNTGEFIGILGLNEYPEDQVVPNSPFVEIGWRLAKAHWGKGYAFEGASAVLDYAFTVIQLEAVYAITSVINEPSWRLMEKLGMRNTHQDFNHPKLKAGHNLERHYLYKIEQNFYLEK